MTFESIEQFKIAAEFFRKGSIIPRRILKTKKKFQHKLTFGSDSWVLPTESGYLVAIDQTMITNYVIRFKPGLRNASVIASPYTKNGITKFIGNFNKTDEQWLEFINKKLK
jgi:hypothetical protein